MILTLAASVASAIAALVMGMTYGLDITSNEDRFLRAAIEALKSTLRVMVPGAFLVDIIPMRAFRTDYEKQPNNPAYDSHSQIRSQVVPRGGFPNLREGSSREVGFGCRRATQVRERIDEGGPAKYSLPMPWLTVMTSVSPTGVVTLLSLGHVSTVG